MLTDGNRRQLRALPMQLVETPDAVILKRGCTEVRIEGEGVKGAVERLLVAFSGSGATEDDVAALFAPADRPAVESLIKQMAARRLLVPEGSPGSAENTEESRLDVFYWHFNTNASDVARGLGTRRIRIVGVNSITQRLLASLPDAAMTDVEVIDYPPLRNITFFDPATGELANAWNSPARPPLNAVQARERLDAEPPDCIVATSDFGGLALLRGLNRFCVGRDLVFLPVVLQNLIGYVGPLVVPQKTACYECVWVRQNSQLPDPQVQRAAEFEAMSGQAVAGYHPSMASVLADIATIELTKFFSGVIPGRRAGALIEVNLLRPSMEARKALKVPRCPVCSPLNRTSPVTTQLKAHLPFD